MREQAQGIFRAVFMDGLLLIDKPVGVTSFDVVKRVRRVCGVRKVGHTGTLDPQASGLLPVVLGRCTKLAKYLSGSRKAYEFTFKLGEHTETLDAEGEVVETCEWGHVRRADLEAALGAFVGKIEQVPPRYSAIKIKGKRAYDLARRGEELRLAARPVEVFSLELLGFEAPMVEMRVECGSGTYVRSLVRDLAGEVGSCAYTTSIRRTSVGGFDVKDAMTLERLDRALAQDRLLPPVDVVSDLGVYRASVSEVRALGFGQKPVVDDSVLAQVGDVLAVVDDHAELVAVALVRRREDGARELKPERVFKPHRG